MLALCAANAAYLAGLEDAVPGGACLVAGTGAPLAAMLRRGGVVATTLDEHRDMLEANPGPLSSGVVVGAAPVVQLFEDRGVDAVLPFKSGSRLWRMADWQGLDVLATDHKLTRQLENKLALVDIARDAEARLPDTVTVRLDEHLAKAALEDGIALPRVFQPAVGFAGAGTVMLRSGQDVADLVAHPPGGVAVGKLVEYIEGEPITINGVVIPAGVHGAGEQGEVLVAMAARQLTGLRGMTPTDFGSCGNDWTLPPSRSELVAARSLAGRVGEVLAARGFAGAFGVDMILPSGGGVPALIEVNPRWTASLALQVETQSMRGLPTLLDAHLAAFGYRPDERTSLEELRAAFGPAEDAGCTRGAIPVATVIAYNSTGTDVHVDPGFEPGVWRWDGGDVTRVRDGWRFAHLETEDEFLALPQGPIRPVHHGSYLVRVVRRGTAASSARADELTDETRALMERVVERVTLRG